MNIFWYNGEFVSLSQPVFTALSRNVNYGDGVFETLRIKNGKICFWDFHFERLQKGIKVLKLVPDIVVQDKTLLHGIILDLTEKNKIKNSVKVKIQVYREEQSGKKLPVNAKTFIFCSENLPDEYELISKHVIVYPEIFLHYSVLSPLKTLNRLPYVLAGIYAQTHQVQDAVLLNTRQELTETTHSNLFYIIENEIYTPPLISGCLEGVLRSIILHHFKVKEKSITVNELHQVESIFTTNVIRGISPVLSFRGADKTFNSQHFLIKRIFEFLNTL